MIQFSCVSLLASVSLAIHTTVAKSSATESLPFGRNSFPTVLFDLQAANHSGTKCVSVNGRPLCTTIDFCSLDYYKCTSVSPQGHYCVLTGPGCICSATWGTFTDDEAPTECECYVSGDGPYWVHADVRCPRTATKDTNFYANFLLGNVHTSCSDPWDAFYSGVPDGRNETMTKRDENPCRKGSNLIGYTEVSWDCPANDADTENGASISSSTFRPDEQCTCYAFHHYQECSSCEPCAAHEPGDFRVTCPGFFMDCFQTFSVWDHESGRETPSSGSNFGRGFLFTRETLSVFAFSWVLSSLLSH